VSLVHPVGRLSLNEREPTDGFLEGKAMLKDFEPLKIEQTSSINELANGLATLVAAILNVTSKMDLSERFLNTHRPRRGLGHE
jgi:hypothetical protein